MEVLVDDWGYMVSIDSPAGELDRLENDTLEGEILSVTNEEPYNVPTGKILSLRRDGSIEKMTVSYYPEDTGWKELQRIDVRISDREYKEIYFDRGRILGTTPRLSTNFLIRDVNAV